MATKETKQGIDLSKLNDDELDSLISDLEEEKPKDIGLLEGISREAFTSLVPGGQFFEAGARSLVGPETASQELEMVRQRQQQFREESPRAAILGGMAGGIGQTAALAALPGGLLANMGRRALIGTAEQGIQAAAEGAEAENTALRAGIGGVSEAFLPMLPSVAQKGIAGAALGAGLSGEGGEAEWAGIGGATAIGAGKVKNLIPSIITSAPGRRWLSRTTGLENDSKTLANWASSISLGGTLKNIESASEKKMGASEAISKQQEIGKQALEEGFISGGKSKKDVYKEINGAFAKDSDLRLVAEGVVDASDAPILAYKDTRTDVGGKISKLSQTVDKAISDFEAFYREGTKKPGLVDIEDFTNELLQDVDKRVGIGGFTPKDAEAIKREIKDVLDFKEKRYKVPEIPGSDAINETVKREVVKKGALGEPVSEIEDYTFKLPIPKKIKNEYVTVYEPTTKKMSLSELNVAKRKLGSKLSDKHFLLSKEQTNVVDAITTAYRGIKNLFDDHIDDLSEEIALQLEMPKPKFAETISGANESISKLIKIREFLDKDIMASDKGFKNFGKLALAPATSAITGGFFGGPLGAITAGITAAGLQDYGQNTLPKQVALALSGAKVPKTLPDIITNKDMIATKMLLAGNAKMAEQFLWMANNAPEQIEKMMPTISAEHPELFPMTEYQSEYIDDQGQKKLTNETDKEIFRSKVRADEGMSNTEKAMKVHQLNKNGVIGKAAPAPNPNLIEVLNNYKSPIGNNLDLLLDKLGKGTPAPSPAPEGPSMMDTFMKNLSKSRKDVIMEKVNAPKRNNAPRLD